MAATSVAEAEPMVVAGSGTRTETEGASAAATSPGTEIVGVTTFAQIFGAGTYSELFWLLGLGAVLQVVLSLTRWGIYTVSIGGNRLGAAEAGINTRLVMLRKAKTAAEVRAASSGGAYTPKKA